MLKIKVSAQEQIIIDDRLVIDIQNRRKRSCEFAAIDAPLDYQIQREEMFKPEKGFHRSGNLVTFRTAGQSLRVRSKSGEVDLEIFLERMKAQAAILLISGKGRIGRQARTKTTNQTTNQTGSQTYDRAAKPLARFTAGRPKQDTGGDRQNH